MWMKLAFLCNDWSKPNWQHFVESVVVHETRNKGWSFDGRVKHQ
jgi:hypothetical protein